MYIERKSEREINIYIYIIFLFLSEVPITVNAKPMWV